MKHELILISLQRSRRQKLCNVLHFGSIVLFHFIRFLLHGIVWDAHTWFYECFLCFKSAAFVFITFVLFPFAVVSIILARKHTFQKVWSSIHSGTYVPQPFQEYSMLDLQNQQKGKFTKVFQVFISIAPWYHFLIFHRILLFRSFPWQNWWQG